jgi:hypothetical protein
LEVAVKNFARFALIALVSSGMVCAPAFAGTADEKPLGLVTQATMAQLGDASATIGTTVYPGDTVATNQGGLLRLRVGTSQIYLLSQSSAVLSSDTSKISAKVLRGTVGISTTSSDPVSLELPEGILRPANGQPVYGQAAILSPNEVVITAYSGSLVLDNDGELHEIPAGKSVKVTMDLQPSASNSDPQEAEGAQTGVHHHEMKSAHKRHLLFDVIMVGLIGGGAYAAYEVLTISPSGGSTSSN